VGELEGLIAEDSVSDNQTADFLTIIFCAGRDFFCGGVVQGPVWGTGGSWTAVVGGAAVGALDRLTDDQRPETIIAVEEAVQEVTPLLGAVARALGTAVDGSAPRWLREPVVVGPPVGRPVVWEGAGGLVSAVEVGSEEGKRSLVVPPWPSVRGAVRACLIGIPQRQGGRPETAVPSGQGAEKGRADGSAGAVNGAVAGRERVARAGGSALVADAPTAGTPRGLIPPRSPAG